MNKSMLALLALAAALAGSGLVFAQCPNNPNGLRACGRKLADLRALVCFQEVKRGRTLFQDAKPKNNADVDTDVENLTKMDVPWLQNFDAVPRIGANELVFWPQQKRASGIVSECCYNCCTIEQIQEYC